MINMTEKAAIEVVCQSSPFYTSILNRGIWFRRALLFRMSNTSSSWPKQPHVAENAQAHTVNTNRLRCITVDRKSRNLMLSFTLFLLRLFSLAGNCSCFFRWFTLGGKPFVGFHNLFLTSAILIIAFGFLPQKERKELKQN